MNPQISRVKAIIIVLTLLLCAMGSLLLLPPSKAVAQGEFFAKPIAEKKIEQLPAGSLYWRLENFPTLAQAQAAGGPTSLAAEVSGKVWLFTLGPKGNATVRQTVRIMLVSVTPRRRSATTKARS